MQGKNPKSANRRKTGDGGRDGTDGAQIPRSRGDESDGAAQSRTGREPAAPPPREDAPGRLDAARPAAGGRRVGGGEPARGTKVSPQMRMIRTIIDAKISQAISIVFA